MRPCWVDPHLCIQVHYPKQCAPVVDDTPSWRILEGCVGSETPGGLTRGSLGRWTPFSPLGPEFRGHQTDGGARAGPSVPLEKKLEHGVPVNFGAHEKTCKGGQPKTRGGTETKGGRADSGAGNIQTLLSRCVPVLTDRGRGMSFRQKKEEGGL